MLDESRASGTLRRRRACSWSVESEDGFSLIEILISVVIISILLTALSVGVITAVRATSDANRIQRAEVALTALGETVKQLDYVQCATPADYNALLQKYLVDQAATARPELTVVGIDLKITEVVDCQDAAADPGTQVVDLRVTSGTTTRNGQIVKRDPDAVPERPTAVISAADLINVVSGPPDRADGPQVGVQLVGSTSTAPEGSSIVEYRWDFGDTHSRTTYPDDPDPVHLYTANAPTKGDSTFTVKLTVVDQSNGQDATTRSVTVPEQASPPPPGFQPAPPDPPVEPPPDPGAPGNGPVPAPTGIHKTGSGCCDTYGDIAWDPVPGATQFEIVLDGYFGGGCVTDHSAKVAGPTSGRVRAGGLCLGSKYNVYVRAYADGDWGPWSQRVRITL